MSMLAQLQTFASAEARRAAFAAQHRAILERSREAIARSLRLLAELSESKTTPRPPLAPGRPRSGRSVEADTMLVDLSAAYAEALRMLPQLWQDAERAGRDPSSLALDLTDCEGKLLLRVPFDDLHRQAAAIH